MIEYGWENKCYGVSLVSPTVQPIYLQSLNSEQEIMSHPR